MQDEQEFFTRRRFLQWSAAGAAAAATAPSVQPLAAAQIPASIAERKPPAHSLSLRRSSELHVVLDSGSGLPYVRVAQSSTILDLAVHNVNC